MNCRAARRLLSDRLDAPLRPADAARLAEHLGGCRDCRRFEHSLTTSLTSLRALPPEPPNPALRRRVDRYVLRDLVSGARPAAPWWTQTAGIGAAALALLVVALLVSGLIRSLGGASPRGGESPAGAPPPAAIASPSPPRGATLWAGAAASPEPRPSSAAPLLAQREPEPMDELTAVDRINAYFTSINNQDYAAAYALFGDAMRRAQSLAEFVAGYRQTAHDEVTILSSQPREGSGQRSVAVSIAAHQTDGSVKWYTGSYEVAYERGEARIVGARVLEVAGPTGTPAPLGPPCRLDQIGLEVGLSRAADTVAINVEIANRGDGCVLTTTITVRIEGDGGKPLPIAGNGIPAPFRVPYLPPAGTRAAFEWSNWCPSGRPAWITVAAGDQTRRIESPPVPRCVEARAPSVLRPTPATTWNGTVLRVAAADAWLDLTLPDGTVKRVNLAPGVIYDQRGQALEPARLRPGDEVSVLGQASPDSASIQAGHIVRLGAP